jgi:hypothetical protein
MILGVVPDTNQTITLDTAGGGTRTVGVTDGVFITPANGVTQIRIKGSPGRSQRNPGAAIDRPMGPAGALPDRTLLTGSAHPWTRHTRRDLIGHPGVASTAAGRGPRDLAR